MTTWFRLFPLRRFSLCLVLATLIFACSPAAHAQDGDLLRTAVGELGEAISELLQMAVGKAEVVELEMVQEDIAVMQPEPAKAAKDLVKKRKKRLESYCGAQLAWMNSICKLNDAQMAQLDELLKSDIEKSQTKFAKDNAKNRNSQLADTFPVKFTLRYGLADEMDLSRNPKRLQNILTEEQLKLLKAGAAERRAFHIDATVSRVLNILDEHLYFTSRQREELFPLLQKRLTGLEHASFSIYGYSGYYKQTSVATLLKRGTHLEQFNDAQRARARDFEGFETYGYYNLEQYISFSSQDGVDGWYDKLDESCQVQRSRVHRACAVRTSFMQEEQGLSDRGARYLTVASKGVADKLVGDWKKSTRQQLRTYEEQAGRFGGNFSFSMQVVDLDQIEKHQMWKHTIDKLSAESTGTGYIRGEEMRRTNALWLTGVLDRELWLTSSQRERVAASIEGSLPTRKWVNHYRTYMDEVAYLIIPLFRMSKQDASVFQGAQKEAWDTLRAEFDFNGRYVMVHMQNGGQFHFQLPP